MKIHLIILVLVVAYLSMTSLNNFQNIKNYSNRLTYNIMDITRIRRDQSYLNIYPAIRALELEDLFSNKLLYIIVKIEINSGS